LILIIFSCDEFFIGEDGADDNSSGEDGETPPTGLFLINFDWVDSVHNELYVESDYVYSMTDNNHDGWCLNDDGSVNSSTYTYTVNLSIDDWYESFLTSVVTFEGGTVGDDGVMGSSYTFQYSGEYLSYGVSNPYEGSYDADYELRFNSEFTSATYWSNNPLAEDPEEFVEGLGIIPNTGDCE
jgi:hypothetical protein